MGVRRWGFALVPVALAVLAACTERPAASVGSHAIVVAGGDSIAALVRRQWVSNIDSMALTLDRLEAGVADIDGSPARVRAARGRLTEARLAFKRIEFISAYYEPTTIAAMNGAALPRVEAQEGPEVVFPPEGFQVIEELLYARGRDARNPALVSEVQNLRVLLRRLRTTAAVQVMTDNRVWDAARLEIARIATLGITGYDSPIAQQSLRESDAALRATRDAIGLYRAVMEASDRYVAGTVDSQFVAALAALGTAPSFVAFDRLRFIVDHVNPLAHALERARDLLGLSPPIDRRALRLGARSLFDTAAIDAQAFANPLSDPDRPAYVALGRRLFFEPQLAGDGAQSCAWCHNPARAFTDGRARSASRLPDQAKEMRNTPTVINVGLQNGSFLDQRTAFLEDQVAAVIANRNEMHSDVHAAAVRLARDSTYVNAFREAFGTETDSAVTGVRLRIAIAAYLRALNGMNSRVDRALRGDDTLATEERLGFNLFTGKARCATCHFIPLFNGSVPPAYQNTDVEVIGVPSRPVRRSARIDPDSGRYRITHAAPHLFAFKTPGLRNVALTAPYMHNGVYRTLEAVVDFYNRGGGAGIGIVLPNQTLPATPLRLTWAEQRALVGFMRALTDTAGLTRRN